MNMREISAVYRISFWNPSAVISNAMEVGVWDQTEDGSREIAPQPTLEAAANMVGSKPNAGIYISLAPRSITFGTSVPGLREILRQAEPLRRLLDIRNRVVQRHPDQLVFDCSDSELILYYAQGKRSEGELVLSETPRATYGSLNVQSEDIPSVLALLSPRVLDAHFYEAGEGGFTGTLIENGQVFCVDSRPPITRRRR